MKGWQRLALVGTLVIGGLITLPSTRVTPIAQAQATGLTITSCDGLLANLNQVAASNVNSVLQCKLGDTPATFDSVFALVEFKTEYTGTNNDFTPPGYSYATAQNWSACASATSGSCTVNDGHTGQTVSTNWINDRYRNNLADWFRDCGSSTTDAYTGWHCQTTQGNWQPTYNGFGYYRTVTHQVLVRFGWDNSATLNGRVNSGDNTVTLWWAKALHTANSQLAIDQNVGDVTNINSSDPLTDTITTSFSITRQTLFTLTATGRISGSVTATYNASPWQGTWAVSLIANPSDIASGQRSVLTWGSTGSPTSMSIDNQIGSVSPVTSGSVTTAQLTQTTTFIVTGTWPSGTRTARAVVTVDCGSGSSGGSGGGIGLLVPKAHAVTCLPDLVPDTSAATLKISYEDLYGNHFSSQTDINHLPVGLYDRFSTRIEIDNLKVDNLNPTAAQGVICVDVEPLKIHYDWEITNIACLNHRASATVGGHSSATFEPVVYRLIEPQYNSNFLKYALTLQNRDALSVNILANLDESNKSNNLQLINGFFGWSTIHAHVTWNGSPISAGGLKLPITVNFKDNTTGKVYKVDANKTGGALLAAAPPLFNGPRPMTIWATLAGKSSNAVSLTVSGFDVYEVRLNIDTKFLLLVRGAFEYNVSAGSANNFISTEPLSNGQIVLKATDTGSLVKTKIANGIAAFGSELSSNYYTVKSVNGQYRDFDLLGRPILFTYPDPTRTDQPPNNPPVINANSSTIQTWDTFLGKDCSNSNGVHYCVINDPTGRSAIEATDLPALKNAANRMIGWANYSAQGLNNIYISPDPTYSAGGFYIAGGLTGAENNFIALNDVPSSVEAEIITHEIFHDMDDYYGGWGPCCWVSDNSNYRASVDYQINSDTGRKIWDLVIKNEYTASQLQTGRAGSLIVNRYRETLASEHASLCTRKTNLTTDLTNIAALWQKQYGTPLPNDLTSQRDNFLNRLKGSVAGGSLDWAAAWYRDCLYQ